MKSQPDITCSDSDEKIRELVDAGYRLDMIMPADEPRAALLSRDDETIRLSINPKSQIRNPKSKGRAGMEYRDLVPDRQGGLLIASHIRIESGGEVPDYVHYHNVLFQMIFCKSGWVRVVYEDQGPPFVLNAGDLVLQPPGIRHRVLEASAGAEVIEVTSPSVHETWVDHEMTLPTQVQNSDRSFGGQKFVWDRASNAVWIGDGSVQSRKTNISSATGGRAGVRIVKLVTGTVYTPGAAGTTVIVVLNGSVARDDAVEHSADDCIVVTSDRPGNFTAVSDAELLEVSLSADLVHFFFAVSVPTDFEP